MWLERRQLTGEWHTIVQAVIRVVRSKHLWFALGFAVGDTSSHAAKAQVMPHCAGSAPSGRVCHLMFGLGLRTGGTCCIIQSNAPPSAQHRTGWLGRLEPAGVNHTASMSGTNTALQD